MGDNREWISISDMMAGLMLIFLFIAVLYILEVQKDKKAISKIAITYEELQKELNRDLKEEFSKYLIKWNAEILDNNTVRFKNPEVLFESASAKLKPEFKGILNIFFPKYIRVLQKYKNDIDEVRIEGHTSTKWGNTANEYYRYLNNIKLSQQRAYSVLDHVVRLKSQTGNYEWLVKIMRATGMAFAKPILNNGVESEELSRRVEFRVVTKTREKILEILEMSK